MSYEKYLEDAKRVGEHLKKLKEQEDQLRAERTRLASEATDILLWSELTAFEKFLIWKDTILPSRYKMWEDVYEIWDDGPFYISEYTNPIEDKRDLTLLSSKDAGYRRLLADKGMTPNGLDYVLLNLMIDGKTMVFHD